MQLVAAGIRYVFGERRHGAALVGEQESGQGIPYERHPHDRFVVDYPCESEARHEEEYLEKAFVYPAGQPRFAQRVVHLPCQYAAGRDEENEERDEIRARSLHDDGVEKDQCEPGEYRCRQQYPHDEVGFPRRRPRREPAQVALEVERPDVGEKEQGGSVQGVGDDVMAHHHAEDELQEVRIHVGQAQRHVYPVCFFYGVHRSVRAFETDIACVSGLERRPSFRGSINKYTKYIR